jgi:hypothetical protein
LKLKYLMPIYVALPLFQEVSTLVKTQILLKAELLVKTNSSQWVLFQIPALHNQAATYFLSSFDTKTPGVVCIPCAGLGAASRGEEKRKPVNLTKNNGDRDRGASDTPINLGPKYICLCRSPFVFPSLALSAPSFCLSLTAPFARLPYTHILCRTITYSYSLLSRGKIRTITYQNKRG